MPGYLASLTFWMEIDSECLDIDIYYALTAGAL